MSEETTTAAQSSQAPPVVTPDAETGVADTDSKSGSTPKKKKKKSGHKTTMEVIKVKSFGSKVESPKKQPNKNLGLSELSKQLRVLQAKNQQQEVEIDRLERQLRILADLQGVSVADLREALQAACETEAFGEMQHRLASLRAQLDAAKLTSGSPGKTRNPEEEAALAQVANLQLRVGELEEVEENLRKELSGLYDTLKEQTAKASRLETISKQQQEEIDKLKEENKIQVEEQRVEVEAEATVSPNETAPKSNDRALVAAPPSAILSPADIECLTKASQQAQVEATAERDKVRLLEQQLEARESDHKLRVAQFKARFIVQDERIEDLEQQLSSLYTAFDMLRQEQQQETKRRESLQENLYAADSQVARQVSDWDIGRHSSRRVMEVPPETAPEEACSEPSLAPAPPPPAVSPELSRSSMSMSPPQRKSDVVMSGTLLIRSHDMLKRWKKRRVSLHRTFACHQFIIDSDAPGKSGKAYDLHCEQSRVHKNKQFAPKFPFAFVLYVNSYDGSAPIVHAACADEQDLKNWFSALRAATTRASYGDSRVEEQEASDLAMALKLSKQDL